MYSFNLSDNTQLIKDPQFLRSNLTNQVVFNNFIVLI